MERRCCVTSATLRGVDAIPVEVEVSITAGIPGMSIVGMPDAAINESRERVKAAIKACGFSYPPDKIVVNLAPSYLRKTGSGFDLPIAIGILVASGQIDPVHAERKLVVGELSLRGQVKPVLGMLPIELCAKEAHGKMLCALPPDGLVSMDDLEVQVISSLLELRTGLFSSLTQRTLPSSTDILDFADVGGQDTAKRALQIAACGMHGVLMVGPPGAGKTMLASRIPSILPPLSEQEALETARVFSVVGEDTTDIFGGRRPFRNPHHSVTVAGLVGGGHPIRPGEISLAHNGVLFLDELCEFKTAALQALRQPIEQGYATIVRSDGNMVFPSRFMLVAATNPCPCGYLGDPKKKCECTVPQITAYQNKIGGPLIDRIDIQIDVWRTEFDNVVNPNGCDSAQLRKGVQEGRAFRAERELRQETEGIDERNIVHFNHLTSTAEELLRKASARHDLSGRGIVKTVALARTIADMDQSYDVQASHIAEALMFRVRTSNDEQ